MNLTLVLGVGKYSPPTLMTADDMSWTNTAINISSGGAQSVAINSVPSGRFPVVLVFVSGGSGTFTEVQLVERYVSQGVSVRLLDSSTIEILNNTGSALVGYVSVGV